MKLGSTPRIRFFLLALAVLVTAVLVSACNGGAAPSTTPGAATKPSLTLTLAAYSTPREVVEQTIIPAFQKQWKASQGQDVKFNSTYQGSGTQARAVVAGLEADLVFLSLKPDVTTVVKAGLIKSNWQANQNGIVSRSVVVLAVRKGNPKGIKDWTDLAKPGVQVLTPDPKTSGGAQWNVAAMYGAALRGKVPGVAANNPAAAQQFLISVLKNVVAFDRDARTSITNFEKGIADVAITYENEVLTAQKAGEQIEYVIPASTILIENPAAVVDSWSEKHGTSAVAKGFIEFLQSKDGQRLFAADSFRPVDAGLLAEFSSKYPKVSDQWDISYLGGWPKVVADLFGESGIYQKALSAAR